MGYFDTIKKDIGAAAANLSLLTEKQKNAALVEVAKAIHENRSHIFRENERDIEAAKTSGMSDAMIDRLTLNDKTVDEMLNGIDTVISFPDPVGRSDKVWTTKDGLRITKLAVPLGVLAIIYEGRPNVTVDAVALALKSGNAVVLRGSSSAFYSNLALEESILKGLRTAGLLTNSVHLVKSRDREVVREILSANDFINLVIPRGGADLINRVVREATVPTLQTGEGNNHIYVDESADIQMALNIIKNAKLQRPGTCNAVEKILVHQSRAAELLTKLYEETEGELRFHADERAAVYLKESQPLEAEELRREYLDYVLGVKVVDDIREAIEHINRYTTSHSECIITESLSNASRFQSEVDAAAVYVNASTRFTDGGQFGFGLEMGISTQKMHARGPVGLEDLVSSKYLIIGNGQVRA